MKNIENKHQKEANMLVRNEKIRSRPSRHAKVEHPAEGGSWRDESQSGGTNGGGTDTLSQPGDPGGVADFSS